MTPTPDPLYVALEALVDLLDAWDAALAPAPPLDVERLAVAMHADLSTCLHPNARAELLDADLRAHRAVAIVVAREYAALSGTTP